MSSVVEAYRGRSVRVFRLNRERCLRRLRASARRLVEGESDVVEVRLFGSLARGDAGPGSDADLLILDRDASIPFLQRAGRLQPYFSVGVGCEFLVYTPEEWRRMGSEGSRLVRVVEDEGLLLAGR